MTLKKWVKDRYSDFGLGPRTAVDTNGLSLRLQAHALGLARKCH